MRVGRLSEMINGWFVGDFEPTMHSTAEVEVAVKQYRAGDREPLHHHRIATEITVVVNGDVEMQDRHFGVGEIIVLPPGESSAFTALTDAVIVAVKVPAAKKDKYLDNPA